MNPAHFTIETTHFTIDDLKFLLKNKNIQLKLSNEVITQIANCRQFLEQKIADPTTLYYGINTGFGSLCNVRIAPDDLNSLQEKLIRSHAVGTGETVPEDIVRLMLILKIKSLSQGFSGVRIETIQRLVDFYNSGILPVIYQQGSLGASGDLAPLAHLSLPLVGQGEMWLDGKIVAANIALQAKNITPIQLDAKEGIALLNGTQFCTAYALHALIHAEWILKQANLNTAMSLDAFLCHLTPFDARLHEIRPHFGQQTVAKNILELLKGSQLSKEDKEHVQDPYAFRCVPQVHGASMDTIEYAKKIILTECNAVTDNPNIFPDSDSILSGGNFHAQPIALIADFLAIALSELASIAERRVYQLISGQRGLATFLTPKPGLNSGLMIAQYTAASIVSQNKQLCTPASVDSIVSCNGQEDHVSMGANAVTKLYRVVENVHTVLAIEFMTACQALTLRLPVVSSPLINNHLVAYRQKVDFMEEDRVLFLDVRTTKTHLETLFE